MTHLLSTESSSGVPSLSVKDSVCFTVPCRLHTTTWLPRVQNTFSPCRAMEEAVVSKVATSLMACDRISYTSACFPFHTTMFVALTSMPCVRGDDAGRIERAR